jgi:hypothetical protein
MASGFANRFLWVCVERSKLLPHGGNIEAVDWGDCYSRLRAAVEFAQRVERISMDKGTHDVWEDLYHALAQESPGISGFLLARSEPQIIRMACIYALLDRKSIISQPHLDAAVAIWDYCDQSVKYIFGDSLGDYVADRILAALRQAKPEPLSRTDINYLLSRNQDKRRIDAALALLLQTGLVGIQTQATSGRPTELWYAK